MFFFGLFRKKSGSIAKERLANVLVSDRARCAPNTLRSIQTIFPIHYRNIWKSIQKPLILKLFCLKSLCLSLWSIFRLKKYRRLPQRNGMIKRSVITAGVF